MKIIVEDIIDDLISKVEEELMLYFKRFSNIIETQMAQFSRQSRDSIYRLGTQRKDLDCGPSCPSSLNMEDIVVGVIDAVKKHFRNI